MFLYFRLQHWDVNNEALHGDFYERRTGNANITMDMFRDVHAIDPNVKLFLNDYHVMENTTTTVTLYTTINACYKGAGIKYTI